MHGSTIKRLIGATAVVSTIATLTAAAGQPDAAGNHAEKANQPAVIGAPVSPESGAVHLEPAPEGRGDEAIRAPQHPDVDLIPPMPMPKMEILRAGFDVESTDSMTFFDAVSGERFELPVTAGFTEALGGSGGQAFVGADERVEDEWAASAQGTEGGRGLGSQTIISDSSLGSYPWRANVKLFMEFDNGAGGFDYFVCSGTMQDSGVVLTAGHCIYNRDYPAFATRVWIYPGWDGDGGLGAQYAEFEKYGYAIARNYIVGTDWVNNGNLDRDVAAIRINRNETVDGGRNVGALTGTFGWAWGFGCGDIQSRTYNNASYPSEGCGSPGLHNGRDMTYWFGSIDNCPGNQLEINTSAGCYTAMWGGQSGSGVYYSDNGNRLVHGVASTSNRSTRARYAKLWEQFTVDLENFKTTQRGNALDLEPLQVRSAGATSARAGTTFASEFDAAIVNATNNNPPQQQVTLRVYLSSNNNISAGDRLLATWNYNPNLAANSVTNFNIPAPSIPLDVTPGDYYIGVIVETANDNNANNNDSDSWDAQPVTILTANAPTQPGLVSPANFSTGRPLGQNIDWSPSSNATGYDVYFGTDSTPDSGELVATNITGTFYTTPPLNYDTTYYWRVVARGPGGNTTSPTWRFTTESAPFFDLSANSVFWQNKQTYTQGEPIDIFHNVSNIGTTTSIAFNIDMRLSTNTTISVADYGLGTRGILGLSAGGNNTGTNEYTIPTNIPNGTYYLGMFFNPNPNGDSNSSNNTVLDTLQVTVNKCAADIAFPWGVLDLADIDTFITGFTTGGPDADVAFPFGQLDLADIDAFIISYQAGCP